LDSVGMGDSRVMYRGPILSNGVLLRSNIVSIVLLGGTALSFGVYGVGRLRSRVGIKLVMAWALRCGIGWFVWPHTDNNEATALGSNP
jgi:predicted MFS family arabinose efflux permease